MPPPALDAGQLARVANEGVAAALAGIDELAVGDPLAPRTAERGGDRRTEQHRDEVAPGYSHRRHSFS
jgi:hypothetical protein